MYLYLRSTNTHTLKGRTSSTRYKHNMNTSLEAHECGIGELTREALVPIGSGPNKESLTRTPLMRRTKSWMTLKMPTTKEHVSLLNPSQTRKYFRSPLSWKTRSPPGTSSSKNLQEGPRWAKKLLRCRFSNSSMSRRKQQMKRSTSTRPSSTLSAPSKHA